MIILNIPSALSLTNKWLSTFDSLSEFIFSSDSNGFLGEYFSSTLSDWAFSNYSILETCSVWLSFNNGLAINELY